MNSSNNYQLSKYIMNVNGCIRHADINGAQVWLEKASAEMSSDDFFTFIDTVEATLVKWPDLVKYVYLRDRMDDGKNQLERLKAFIKSEEIDKANKLYGFYESVNQGSSDFPDLRDNYLASLEAKRKKSEENLRLINSKQDGLKSEIQIDLANHFTHAEYPSFKRIQLPSISFFVTKSHVRSRELLTGKNKHGSYRILNWTDPRSRHILTKEIGDAADLDSFGHHNGLDNVELIGDYTPKDDDLIDVKYSSKLGRAYYKSARDTLSGKTSDSDEYELKTIDAGGFMHLDEVVPTAAQSKALFSYGSYILDGPAGTGKSTTILQKVLLLKNEENDQSDDILILVKHLGVENTFKELLANLDVYDTPLMTTHDFVKDCLGVDAIEKNVLSESMIQGKNLHKIFNESVSRSDDISNSEVINNFKSLISGIQSVDSAFMHYRSVVKRYLNEKKKLNFKESRLILDDANKVRSIIDDLKKELRIKKFDVLIKSEIRKLKKAQENKLLWDRDNDDELLRKANEYAGKVIDEEVESVKSKKDKEFIAARKEKLRYKYDELNKINEAVEIALFDLEKAFYSEESFRKIIGSRLHAILSLQYVLRVSSLNIDPPLRFFGTIIIDEAQDVSEPIIGFSQLLCNQLILVGDEAQKEKLDGVGVWKNINSSNCLPDPGGLSTIYSLRHNFRQTYELGSASYNFRQLILGRNIENIKEDYFDDQIGYWKPRVSFIKTFTDLKHAIEKTKQKIADFFTDNVPITLIYDDDALAEKLKNFLTHINTSYSDDLTDVSSEVLMVNSRSIAGSQFPVVMALVSSNVEDSSLYIILSRAKFDLTLLYKDGEDLPKKLQKLIDENIIDI